MLPRSLAIRVALLATAAAFALPLASAHASDPLLSGYGGPGGGTQVVLGGTTVDTTKGSGSSSAQNPAEQDLKADAPKAAAPASTESGRANSTLTSKPQRQKPSSSSSQSKGDDEGRSATKGGTTTATPPGAPKVVAYPTRAGEVGDVPVAGLGFLLIVLGVAAAALVGLGLRRLCGSDRAPDPQVSAR